MKREKKSQQRSSGVLLHVSSLPSCYGIGDLGSEAYRFVDFLKACGQRYWQILPLNPTDGIFGNSPYSSPSAFALDPIFINPNLMVQEGWLKETDLRPVPSFPPDRTDYEAVRKYKSLIFQKAFANFKKDKAHSSRCENFCSGHRDWLEDYALFGVLKAYFLGDVWSNWPDDLRLRKPNALKEIRRKFSEELEKIKFLQYVIFQQWSKLKAYCQEKGVQFIGDMSFYVNDDSADVWSHPRLFKLDSQGNPLVVAGVPPDYFSETGQRWGNPIYHWENLRKTHYAWWLRRIEHNLKIFDFVRFDHFRGFIGFWEIPASEKTAVHGKWVSVPHKDFFKQVAGRFPRMPFIAEDLGIITPDVTEARIRLGLPGMKILLFAFDGEYQTHPYFPGNFTEDCVVYTGTHDNNTVRGWFEEDISESIRENLFQYFGRPVESEEISTLFVQMAMMSKARIAIIPMQDILGLGSSSRMNRPATTQGNWQWRLSPEAISAEIEKELLETTIIAQRA